MTTPRFLQPLIWITTLCSGITGCLQADFGELRVEQRSFAPLTVDAEDDEVVLPEGIAVRLKVKPISGNNQKYTSNDDLEFSSDNSAVMDAFQIDKSSDVVVTGVRPGRACLRVIVNNEEVTCLDVRVVEQPARLERDR